MSALTKDDISDMSNEQQAKYCYWCFYKDYGNCNHCALVHLVTPNNRVHADAGDSPVSTSSLQASADTTSQTVTQTAQRG